MKRFLIYVIIIVTFLFFGFAIYYLLLNNERIYLKSSANEAIYRNVGESIWLENLIKWEKPYKTTKLNVLCSDSNIVSYDENSKRFICGESGVGGFTSVTITPTNEDFGPFIFEIYVGDGSLDNPWVIDSTEDLAIIGTDPAGKFESSDSYVLACDLELSKYNDGKWNPIATFSGNFDGNGKTIHNLNVENATNAGLFAELEYSAFVQNVRFSNAVLNGSFENAGVVSGINKGTIGKVEVVSANVTNTYNGNTGLITGKNIKDASYANVSMCSATGNINALGNVGGLVGLNKSSVIINSKAVINYIKNNDSQSYVGGLVGVNESSREEVEGTYLYTPSAIKNSYVIINLSELENCNFGLVVGNNKEASYSGQMVHNAYDGVIYSYNKDNDNVSDLDAYNIAGAGLDKIQTESLQKITYKSKDELLNKENYNGWYNFETVWKLEENKVAELNYEGNYENYKLNTIGNEINSDDMTLVDFLTKLKDNYENNTTTYKVTKSETINLDDAYWTTIAKSIDNPLKASIIVEDGVSCVIKNFKLKDDNSSFFGYISNNAVISGITFENVTVESCTAQNSAIVASGLLNGASLENITVSEFNSINTTAENVGVICGYNNNGIIKNCIINNEVLKEVKISTTQGLVNFGSVVGYNKGSVDNNIVNRVKLVINTELKDNGNFNIGGAVGLTETTINKCLVDSFVLETANKGVMYVGGVVGYTSNANLSVSYSYSYATISINEMNENAFLAGIAGYVGSNTTVNGCFYDSSSLSAYNVGGLAGISFGTITKSYVGECSLSGIKVGGLANLTYGNLTDCYVLSTLSSLSSDGRMCGITYFVGANCLIERNFSNATFNGLGTYYAEAFSSFRVGSFSAGISNFFGGNIHFGEFRNNIIIVNNDAKIQKKGFLSDADSFIKVTADECKGIDGSYEAFRKAGFEDAIWSFDPEFGFPTFKEGIVITVE